MRADTFFIPIEEYKNDKYVFFDGEQASNRIIMTMAVTKITPTKATRELVADTIESIKRSGAEDDIRMLQDFAAKYDWPEPVFE